MHVQVARDRGLNAVEELAKLNRAMPRWQWPMTVPAFTSSAAKSEVVPCRM